MMRAVPLFCILESIISVCGLHAAHGGPGAISMLILEEATKRRVESQDSDWQNLDLGDSSGQQPLIQQLKEKFPARYFRQPLDHFSKSTNETFLQRYWVNLRHYQPGGSVFVLDGGETSGEDRLHFLDTGVMNIFPNATKGIGIVLEHRYYGESIPVKDFSTDSLRWLNNDQSAADSANFMANVKIDGIDEDITAPGTPWIYYGGSYAGARAAHMRVLYPDLVFGAIASSAVTHAQISYWEYYDLIRNYTQHDCRVALELSILTVDRLLAMGGILRHWVKSLFGLGGLKDDRDFASVLHSPLGGWQAMNWDPAVGPTTFKFCQELIDTKSDNWGTSDMKLFESPELDSSVPFEDEVLLMDILTQQNVHLPLFNYARYVRKNIVNQCENATVEECFGTGNPEKFRDTSINSTWRAWTFQVCTEWGYFQTAPPDPKHPSILSRLLDLEYTSNICKLAFPPGKEFSVPNWPNVTAVNALGDFNLSADRLAFVDGEIDPWRPATPHSNYAKPREDTTLRPFKLIPNGVHHWDENGLESPDKEPAEIQKIHREELQFIRAWLEQWESLE